MERTMDEIRDDPDAIIVLKSLFPQWVTMSFLSLFREVLVFETNQPVFKAGL